MSSLQQFWLWVCGLGVIAGILAAIQQFRKHGWRDFLRTVAWFAVVGLLLAFVYYLQVNSGGNTADIPSPLGAKPGKSELIGTQRPDAKSNIANAPVPPRTKPADTELVDAEAGGTERRDARSANTKPPGASHIPRPTPLPAHQTVFAPSEVLFCPDCGKAYSSGGLRDNVECAKCGHTVMLRSDPTRTVFRCISCSSLLKTWYKLPYTGPLRVPTIFPYYCPVCGKDLWFKYPVVH